MIRGEETAACIEDRQRLTRVAICRRSNLPELQQSAITVQAVTSAMLRTLLSNPVGDISAAAELPPETSTGQTQKFMMHELGNRIG